MLADLSQSGGHESICGFDTRGGFFWSNTGGFTIYNNKEKRVTVIHTTDNLKEWREKYEQYIEDNRHDDWEIMT